MSASRNDSRRERWLDCRAAPLVRILRRWLILSVLASMPYEVAFAQSTLPVASSNAEATRIDGFERMLESVAAENRRLSAEVRALQEQLTARESAPPTRPTPFESTEAHSIPSESSRLPLTDRILAAGYSKVAEQFSFEKLPSDFRISYENGFAILPQNIDETPFSLRVRSQNVFRYNGFARGETTWTDSAGNQLPIVNSSYFGIPTWSTDRSIASRTTFSPFNVGPCMCN